jgi:hypothetical protein
MCLFQLDESYPVWRRDRIVYRYQAIKWEPKTLRYNWAAEVKVKFNVILRPTVSRPVCPGIRPPYGISDQLFALFHGNFLQTFAVVLVWDAISEQRIGLKFTRNRTTGLCQSCHSQVQYSRIRNQIITLPFETGFTFYLLRLAGLRWQYCDPPEHGVVGHLFLWVWRKLKWGSNLWSPVLRDSYPRLTELAKPRSNCASKLQTYSLVREGPS